MRALCGAIITAGALIGLGLTAIGVGYRYAVPNLGPDNPNTHTAYGAATLVLILVVLLLALLIGLATAFLGLAFHHYRRHHEHLRDFGLAHRGNARVGNGVGAAPTGLG